LGLTHQLQDSLAELVDRRAQIRMQARLRLTGIWNFRY
jgi:hypothetical protein